jgi:hypothetical protein
MCVGVSRRQEGLINSCIVLNINEIHEMHEFCTFNSHTEHLREVSNMSVFRMDLILFPPQLLALILVIKLVNIPCQRHINGPQSR